LQSGEAAFGEAFAPQADGMAVAVQSVGDVLVGRAVGGSGPEDDAAAEGQRLGRGTGAGEGLEAVSKVRREDET
jgi:hypothetical protein